MTFAMNPSGTVRVLHRAGVPNLAFRFPDRPAGRKALTEGAAEGPVQASL